MEIIFYKEKVQNPSIMSYFIKWSPSQAKEIQIRKQYSEAVKTQTRQYKALKEQILQNTPKAEQKTVVKKLKDEQMRKLNNLNDQYEASIAEMLQQQNVSFSFLSWFLYSLSDCFHNLILLIDSYKTFSVETLESLTILKWIKRF